jgi:hypothetical protein
MDGAVFRRPPSVEHLDSSMAENSERLTLFDPAMYRICVQGWLESGWSEYFGGIEITHQAAAGLNQITILIGPILDQADLIGLINRLYGLGLPLISVQLIAPAAMHTSGEPRNQGL